MKLKTLFTIGLPMIFAAGQAIALTDAEIDASFNPYQAGPTTSPGITPGMKIDKSNAQKFRDIIDPATYALIEQGKLEFPVEETHSIALHPNYIAATKKHSSQVKLGSATGTIEGYVAGRPFPGKPDKSDPRAGEKLPRHPSSRSSTCTTERERSGSAGPSASPIRPITRLRTRRRGSRSTRRPPCSTFRRSIARLSNCG